VPGIDASPCPRCGEPVESTITRIETGDQLAVEQIGCPHCGARLVRDIQGHVDRGWRLDDETDA